jgi:glycosyltransferase involved in cell wall biosynthesis
LTHRIVVLGPVAISGAAAAGGFQSSNLRLVAVLRSTGAQVDVLRYPDAGGSLLRKTVSYAVQFSRIMLQIVSADGTGRTIHFTPLRRHFLPAEIVFALAARARGNRLVIDLRAGAQETDYRRRSRVYRWLYRRFLGLATAIAYEGRVYAPFLREVAAQKPARWLPNFVTTTSVRERPDSALPASPRLIYLGRVSEAKGATAALHLLAALRRRLPGATLTLIGAADPDYIAQLRSQGLLGDGVEITGPLPPDHAQRRLDESHFFVFLTRWIGEGHSNALTEAMARGCVPVCTRHGFNADVVASTGLVVDDRDDSHGIAAAIEKIWTQGDWSGLSHSAVTRVAVNYTDTQVVSVVRDLYDGSSDL